MFYLLVFAIIKNKQKILLVNNLYKEGLAQWSLPGGSVEKGETLQEAVYREVLEETHYNLTKLKIAYIHENITPSTHAQAVIFEAQIDEPGRLLCDSSEINDPAKIVNATKWILIKDLPNYIEPKFLIPLQNWLTYSQSSHYFITREGKK